MVHHEIDGETDNSTEVVLNELGYTVGTGSKRRLHHHFCTFQPRFSIL